MDLLSDHRLNERRLSDRRSKNSNAGSIEAIDFVLSVVDGGFSDHFAAPAKWLREFEYSAIRSFAG